MYTYIDIYIYWFSNTRGPPYHPRLLAKIRQGRLVMAFDATYLFQTLTQLTLNHTRGVAGGAWSPQDPDNSFVFLEKGDVQTNMIRKASLMMHFLAWCPSARKKTPLSVASIPLDQSFTGEVGGFATAQRAMLNLVGTVLAEDPGCVRAIVFDAHTSHVLIRKLLHGLETMITPQELQAVPFFGQLKFKDLSSHKLPRLPVRICLHQDEAVWEICGPCF